MSRTLELEQEEAAAAKAEARPRSALHDEEVAVAAIAGGPLEEVEATEPEPAPEVRDLDAEAQAGEEDDGPPPPEAEVINHLLFHKSLIDDHRDVDRLNAYIRMVKENDAGAHVVMINPFDRAIAIAFQLVIEKHLDPWRLDLVQFTEMYMEHVRRSQEVDLITAGRLIHLAWSVLKLQSDEALVRAEAAQREPEPEPEELSWDDIPTDEWLTAEDGSYEFTTTVLRSRQAPIDEKIRHRGDRKVTLFELVEAFEEARADAERRMILDAKRSEAKRLWARTRKEGVKGAAHKEDLEAEIREVWGRIVRLNGHPIPLTDLHEPEKDDMVKALVSVLFLARERRVTLWQEDFPYGQIYVRNLHPDHKEFELLLRPEDTGPSDEVFADDEEGEAERAALKARAAKRKARAAARKAWKPFAALPPDLPAAARLQLAAALAHRLAEAMGWEDDAHDDPSRDDA